MNIRRYLNERAEDIEAMGLRVHRIPMPKPSP